MVSIKFKLYIRRKINDKMLCSKDDLLLIMEEITNESARNYTKLTNAYVRSVLNKWCDEKIRLKKIHADDGFMHDKILYFEYNAN